MDAASIEQMNKVRVALGMAPLPVPSATAERGPQFKPKEDTGDGESEDDLSTLDKRQAAAGSNWQKLENEKLEKLERQKRKDAVKKARDAAQRFQKLEGKGLGEADEGGDLDTKTWLLQQKQRQARIEKARKYQERIDEEMEQQAQYTSKNLAGIKVAHQVDEFDDAVGEQILTLKDAEIGEESEEDELENADLKAQEKQREKLQLKKRLPDYDPTDQEQKKAVLSKYDNEIEGKKQKMFTLDGHGNSTRAQQKDKGDNKMKGTLFNLDILKEDASASDYLEPSVPKFKKLKKSNKGKVMRKREFDEDIVFPDAGDSAKAPSGDAMEVEGNHRRKKRSIDVVDEDLLGWKKLAEASENRKKMKPLDEKEFVRQIKERKLQEERMLQEKADAEDDGGFWYDELTEFITTLKKPEKVERKANNMPPMKTPYGDTDQKEDEEMEDDEDLHQQEEEVLQSTSGMVEEDISGVGLGKTLNLLKKRGVLGGSSSDALVAKQNARAKFLASKQHVIDEHDARAREDRERERTSGRWARMSNRERDNFSRQQNEDRERFLAKLLADQFEKDYKPDVNLRYHDEFGREMNQKEAFKHLSHMFHGKGSGKQKTEKRLKKIENEKKEMAKGLMNVDDDAGMAGVGGREGKRTGQAGVRLQ